LRLWILSGYVKGYGIEKFDRTDIEFTKPTQFNNVTEQLAVTTMGQYVKVNEFVGTWLLKRGTRVQFYDVPQRRITNRGDDLVRSGSRITDR
jgi:hypothetical protein